MADKDKYADEIMSDEELDNVAGGGTRQTVGDKDFLHDMGLASSDSSYPWSESWGSLSTAVDDGWKKVGITSVTKFGSADNLYFLDGKPISRTEAFRTALRAKGWNETAVQQFNVDRYAGSF